MAIQMNRFKSIVLSSRWWNPPLCLALILLLALPASARLKIQNLPLALDDIAEQQFRVEVEGLYCAMASDSTLLHTGLAFSYGLGPYLAFRATVPWQQHTYGNDQKMGQGDALVSLLLHHPRPFGIDLHLGWRSTLRLASGYREEFDGFPSYTAGRIGFENLLIWEFQRHRLKLDAWGGYFSDQAWENQRSIWGAAMRYELWKNKLLLFGEFGHEVNLEDKQTEQQLFAGMQGNLPFDLGWRAGVEQKLISGQDYPGLFAALSYSRQPRVVRAVEQRQLQPQMVRQATAERSDPAGNVGDVLMELPTGIRLALLPFSGECSPDISARLLTCCQRSFGQDTNLVLIQPQEVELALHELNLVSGVQLTEAAMRQLGLWLGADYLLTGDIYECEYTRLAGAGIPWLFQQQRQQYRISAVVTLAASAEGSRLQHSDIRVKREKSLAPHLFSSPRRRPIPLDSPEAMALQQEAASAWAEQALEDLFYTTAIQWQADE